MSVPTMIQLTNSQGAAPIYIASGAINALIANPLDKSTIIFMVPRAIEVVESVDVVLAKLAALDKPSPDLSVGVPVTGADEPQSGVSMPPPNPPPLPADPSLDPGAE